MTTLQSLDAETMYINVYTTEGDLETSSKSDSQTVEAALVSAWFAHGVRYAVHEGSVFVRVDVRAQSYGRTETRIIEVGDTSVEDLTSTALRARVEDLVESGPSAGLVTADGESGRAALARLQQAHPLTESAYPSALRVHGHALRATDELEVVELTAPSLDVAANAVLDSLAYDLSVTVVADPHTESAPPECELTIQVRDDADTLALCGATATVAERLEREAASVPGSTSALIDDHRVDTTQSGDDPTQRLDRLRGTIRTLAEDDDVNDRVVRQALTETMDNHLERAGSERRTQERLRPRLKPLLPSVGTRRMVSVGATLGILLVGTVGVVLWLIAGPLASVPSSVSAAVQMVLSPLDRTWTRANLIVLGGTVAAMSVGSLVALVLRRQPG